MGTSMQEVDYDRDVWEVIVQNIGRGYHGNNASEAQRWYDDYVLISKGALSGRGAGSSVDLYLNGEPYKQHVGTTEEDE